MTPEPGLTAYHLACDHDRNGREAEAIPEYQRALSLGLSQENRRGALLGLGSSLRNVARHTEAVTLLTCAIAEFPEDAPLRAFLALALYSSGDPRSALLHLLELTLRHAPIGEYTRALTTYRDRL